jgi:hypothetical protein
MTVNSISGGKTSAFMAVHYPADLEIFACVCIDCAEAKPKDKAVLRYCEDKLQGNFIASAEREKTLRVMMQLEQLIGKEIVWVRGKSFDQIVNDAGCLPSWKRRFCTTYLKIQAIFEYLYYRFGVTTIRIGFRGDELDRIINTLQADNDHFNTPVACKLYGKKQQQWDHVYWRNLEFPLAKAIHLDIIQWWQRNHPDFDFPLDSNCAGCHHKSASLINQNYKESPEILNWFSLQEVKKQKTWHDDQVSYAEKFKMNFTERIDFDVPGCSSGLCTD